MSEHPRCPDCGAELPTGATAGLCPKCLLGGVLEGSDALVGEHSPFVPTTPQPGGFVPPGVQSLAASFPQLEIVGLLGHGGMGAVYKARQTKLDRFVALKIIRPESADDPAFAERFTREARTLARLSHPNIVSVHDFGELPGGLQTGSAAGRTLYYFAMEYVDGANLRELMQSGGLRPEQALAIVPQICDALQYAHDEGVVHRDIKPENILVDRRGRVKIADFGLAKLAGQAPENFTLTATHQVMGTPRYMAPEQMAGSRAVDHRADIYSLGVVFYEMLTGELPMGSFEPPSSKTNVDPRLDEVVLRALAREPERRYQRASEVRMDVESILRGELAVSGSRSSDSRPEPERGQSAGEAIWEIAGILASGWLVYIVLMVCIGAVVLALRTPISTQRASDVPGGPASAPTPGWIVLAAVILVAGSAGLLKYLRRRSAGRRRALIARSGEIGAPGAPNRVDRQLSSASSPPWSSQQHVSISGPGPSTVLERGLAGLVNPFRPGSDSTSGNAEQRPSSQWRRRAGIVVLVLAIIAAALGLGQTVISIVRAFDPVGESVASPQELSSGISSALRGTMIALVCAGALFLIALTLLSRSKGRVAAGDHRARSLGRAPAGGPDDDAIALPRFSRKAIVGACWAALFFVALLLLGLSWVSVRTDREVSIDARDVERLSRQVEPVEASDAAEDETTASSVDHVRNVPRPPQVGVFVLWPLLLVGIPIALAPFGTTILGLVAISDIRHSQGRLTGLPLAFADAVLFPTLFLNAGALAAAYFVFEEGSPRELRGVAIAVAALVCVMADFVVLRSFWRAAERPPGGDATWGAGRTADSTDSPLLSQPPLARYDFTAPPTSDVAAMVTFHFQGLGYRLVRERPNAWVFQRGRTSAALVATDIRAYHTTLSVRAGPRGDGSVRIVCAWAVRTFGAFDTDDVTALQAEGRELEALLRPDRSSSGWAPETDSAARPAAESPGATEQASLPDPFPDLDLRRIQMQLKGPAVGLLIVAFLGTVFWCAMAVMLAGEILKRRGVDARFRPPPTEVAIQYVGIAATAVIVLLAAGVLVYGARQMLRMTGYGWCYAASILAMLPWSPLVLLGLPVGIWAFRLLRRQDVRDAFLAKAIEHESAARPSAPRGGRDWVTLTREQVEDDDIPDVCMVCGAPTRERVSRNFEYTPDWAGFLCLFGLFPGLIAVALTQKSMRMACPLCPADRGHWSRLVWVSSIGWLAIVPLGALGYLVTALLVGNREAPLAGAVIGAFAALILWLIPVIYLSSTRVNAKAITEDRITLQRVAPAFARATTAARRQSVTSREPSGLSIP